MSNDATVPGAMVTAPLVHVVKITCSGSPWCMPSPACAWMLATAGAMAFDGLDGCAYGAWIASAK